MSKREFFIAWIVNFTKEISSLDELEAIYDSVKSVWMKEYL